METARFKIDHYDLRSLPFGLYVRNVRKPKLWGEGWVLIHSFATREAARKYYDLIKDLPEYLP